MSNEKINEVIREANEHLDKSEKYREDGNAVESIYHYHTAFGMIKTLDFLGVRVEFRYYKTNGKLRFVLDK